MIVITRVTEDEEFDAIFDIRRQVFVIEQLVPEDEEWDEFEHISRHYMAQKEGKTVGTARWRFTLTGDVKMERFAVLSDYRGQGVGALLVKGLLSEIPRIEGKKIYLHAQTHAADFYKKYKFEPEGELFDEAGISHVKMVYKGE